MKKVTVWSSIGGSKVIDSEATTWAELQRELAKNGMKYDGMKAIVGATKNSLESPEAILPEGDTMQLFLYPVKTKSGALDTSSLTSSEIRGLIKDAIIKDEEGAKAHFNVDKNYTNKSTDVLRALLASYTPPVAGSVVPKKDNSISVGKKGESAKTPKASVADVVSSVRVNRTAKAEVAKVEKPAAETSVAKITDQDGKINQIIDLVRDLDAGSKVGKRDQIITLLNELRPAAKSDLDKDALDKQAREIAKGLSGINY